MEQDAPEQVIGVGTLRVQPDMSAVNKELDDLERRFESLGDIAKKITVGGGESGSVVPAANSPEAARELDMADNARWREEVLTVLQTILEVLRELQNDRDV